MAEVFIDGVEYIPKRSPHKKKRSLCELIYEARHLRGETLEDAAANIGTTKSHLWTLESGASEPRLRMLQRILAHFDIDFFEIEG